MKEKQPEPPRPAPERDDVHVARNRCPYCRDDVAPEASTVCQSCLTRHHAACWDEAGACSSCGAHAALEQAPPRVSGVVALSLAFACAASLVSLLTTLARGQDPSTVQAVSLGVLLMAALVTGARYRQQQRRRG